MARLVFAVLLAVCLGVTEARATALGREESKFPIRISDGETVTATLRVPSVVRQGARYPVLLVFGGFESAGRVLDLVGGPEDIALASFDYPFTAPRRFEFPQSLQAVPELKALFPKTLRGIAELIQVLRKRPDIDANRIVLVGASFGTPFVLAAMARDPELAGVVLVHGFGRAPETLEHVILRSWLPKLGWVARPLAWGLSRGGWKYLDMPSPESLARALRPGQVALMITAEQDSFVPRFASDELWRALEASGAQVSRQMMPTDHLMPGSESLITEVVGRVVSWMGRRGLGRGGG